MAPFTDHYRTLGVHRDAEPAVVEAAYRALARRYHPDVNRHDRNAEDRLKAINAAYAVLSNAAARGTYDREWDAHYAPTPPSAKPPKSPGAKSTPRPGATAGPQPSAKPPPAPSSPRPQQANRPSRPWYVNVAGFAVTILILRVIGDAATDTDAPSISRTARPTATSRPAIGATSRAPSRPTPTARASSTSPSLPGVVLSVPETPSSGSITDYYLDEEATSYVLEPGDWGFAETFGTASAWEGQESEWAKSTVGSAGLVLSIKKPGGFDAYLYDAMPSGGRDMGFRVDVGSTTGWGEISLVLQDANGGPEWIFGVDPVAEQWYLYRTSDYTAEFFYWVEPRPFGAIAPGPLRSIEARVTEGVPSLWINGVDVVKPFGIGIPAMPGSLVAGVGAGINPYSLTGSGDSFVVVIRGVELRGL